MSFNKKIKLVFLLALLLFVLGADFVFALELNYPSIPGIAPPSEQIPNYVQYIIALVIIVSTIIAGFIFVIGGVLYIFSGGSAQRTASAREQMTAAVLGLIILLSSYIILKTINPQLIIIDLPTIGEINIPEGISFPSLPEKPGISINAEIPFGKIIKEKIFESKPRFERIKSIAENSLSIAQKLELRAQNLRSLINVCYCDKTLPVGGTPTGCSCDPCSIVRNQIQEQEKLCLETIGAENEENEITPDQPNLASEQKKIEKEMRLLKEELNKLERAENLMLKCDLPLLSSLAEFFFTKDYYSSKNESETKEWLLLVSKYWKDINIDVDNDYATFYCPISGNIWAMEAEGDMPEELESEMGEASSEEIPEDSLPDDGENPYCQEEIAVGEFIDRAKRLGYKLVERLEKLNDLNKDLIDAVNELHGLISQCSSQRCQPVVLPDGTIVCQPINPEGACPLESIERKTQEIISIVEGSPSSAAAIDKKTEGIIDVVKRTVPEPPEPLDAERKEQIGILVIIKDIIPQFIKDFRSKVEIPMKECISDLPTDEEMSEETDQAVMALSDCESSNMYTEAKGLIEKCCYEEKDFQDCLFQCYLEENYNKYKECLRKCFEKKEQEDPQAKGLAKCKHLVNFYCCGK